MTAERESSMVDLDAPYDDRGRPFSEMRDHGLLWLINTTVFHPRGYSLAFHVEEDGEVTGWSVMGDGTEPWTYPDSEETDALFQAAQSFLTSEEDTDDG